MKTLYSILCIQNFAPIEDIKKAYRVLALKHHPDKGGDTKRMQEINHAYNTLMKQKDNYDRVLMMQLNQVRQTTRIVVNVGSGYWTNFSTTTMWT